MPKALPQKSHRAKPLSRYGDSISVIDGFPPQLRLLVAPRDAIEAIVAARHSAWVITAALGRGSIRFPGGASASLTPYNSTVHQSDQAQRQRLGVLTWVRRRLVQLSPSTHAADQIQIVQASAVLIRVELIVAGDED